VTVATPYPSVLIWIKAGLLKFSIISGDRGVLKTACYRFAGGCAFRGNNPESGKELQPAVSRCNGARGAALF
jgi:hypothetical protein